MLYSLCCLCLADSSLDGLQTLHFIGLTFKGQQMHSKLQTKLSITAPSMDAYIHEYILKLEQIVCHAVDAQTGLQGALGDSREACVEAKSSYLVSECCIVLQQLGPTFFSRESQRQ